MNSDKIIKIEYILEFNKIRLAALKMNIKRIKKLNSTANNKLVKTKHVSSSSKVK
jgi:hypothetical protein